MRHRTPDLWVLHCDALPWSKKEYCYYPLDGMIVHRKTPQQYSVSLPDSLLETSHRWCLLGKEYNTMALTELTPPSFNEELCSHYPGNCFEWEMKNHKYNTIQYNTILTGIQLSYSFQNNLIFKLNRRAYCKYGITSTVSRRISLRTSMALLICAHVCLSKVPSISVGGTSSWVRTETRSDVGGESWSRRPPSTSSWRGK